MKTVDFTQHLLSIQTELFRFAFKLTADREEANDLLQETSLKAWTTKRSLLQIRILKDGCTPSCVIYL